MVFFGDQKIEILQVNQDRLHNSFNFISGSSSQAKVRVTFFSAFFFWDDDPDEVETTSHRYR